MDSLSSIPVMSQPIDLLRRGPNSDNLAASAVQSHPVERMQNAQDSNSLDLDAIRRLYGSALAMRLTTERQNASNVGGRLPGLDAHPNSNAMIDTLTGNDMNIDFGDYLNTSVNRPGVMHGSSAQEKVAVHSAMEAKLGL
eukprot:CAMPEP_0204617458 /NCGR_PEP_ID=MMETSP0717-20131115/4436_1 /ASSEMBLY_ACC=CAM_ASM_000666 /TAXON_ID=230516 /ORGANISM="Chaetoceros curvisetus" /LENGTH=139 /DNA_ID=CAMNT_0051630999 /DNA_START=67 /DNA_END=486 /DNA_ORIENTATION=+